MISLILWTCVAIVGAKVFLWVLHYRDAKRAERREREHLKWLSARAAEKGITVEQLRADMRDSALADLWCQEPIGSNEWLRRS